MQLRDDLTVGGLLRETVSRFPDRPALKTRGLTLTYRQLDAAVDHAARQLLSLGVKKGQHVGTLCEATPIQIILFYALARIGAVNVMFNTSLSASELRELANRSDISIILVGDGYKGASFPKIMEKIMPDCQKISGAMFIGSGDPYGLTKFVDLEPAPVSDLEAAEAAVEPADTAQILFTSGTTSRPKMVMDSHYSRVNCGRFQAKDLAATEEDVFLGALPTFHCFSISVNVMAACAAGACLFLPESRKTSVLLSAIRDFRCTIFSSVPALFYAMIHRLDFKDWDVSSIRTGFIGGSGCSEKSFVIVEQAFGMTLLSSLGQTEATGGITTSNLTDPVELRASTVGHMMDHVEGKIISLADGSDCALGENGEICVRGYVVMQGYYDMPEETAAAIDKDGWLHTGDCGYFLDDGYLRLTGRVKDLIIRGGENISPAEIEELVRNRFYVKRCKAIGIPDKVFGEEVCLCLVPGEDLDAGKYEIRTFLEENLSYYKVPKYIEFFDSFPANATGKVDVNALRSEAIARIKAGQMKDQPER